MNWQKASATGLTKTKAIANHLWHASLKTTHSRFVASGLLVGVAYFPSWLIDLVIKTVGGSASILMVAMTALGLYRFWQVRQPIQHLEASEDDRWLGHLIIICGVVLCPLGFFTNWGQHLVFLLILFGIALSSWGVVLFQRYPLSIALVGLGLFPQPTAVAKTLWEVFTPQKMLENFMAWSGGTGLIAIGQPATVNGVYITLSGKTVEVYSGCSGFDMATILAVASFVLALFLKQSPLRVVLMVVLGVVLALLSNIPRIMLLAASQAYWGQGTFEFWHGPWGGQIFSTILFTIYYYIVMAIAKKKSAK